MSELAIQERIAERYAREAELLSGQSAKAADSLVPDADGMYAYKEARMFGFLAPLIERFGEGEWLTVGDNGNDALALRRGGARRVTASSISAVYLRHLAAEGRLSGIEVIDLNAERIDLPDGAVDIVLCKEAYHHFPRAPLAFYEFLRIGRRGVILIEPIALPRKPLDFVRDAAKAILRRRPPSHEQFEPVGNFIYRVAPGELRRMVTALQIPWFAVRPFNNFTTRRLLAAARRDRPAMLAFRLGVAVQDALSWCRLMNPGMAAIFVPTAASDPACAAALRRAGFRIHVTPRNPYGGQDVFRDFYGG